MSIQNHFLCLNEKEFFVFLSLMKSKSLLAYKGGQECSQEDYNEGLFSLYKRGLLKCEQENDYFLGDEAKGIVQTIDDSQFAITIEGAGLPQYCIYCLDDGIPVFVVTQPGSRKNEYIKLMNIGEEALKKFLYEMDCFDDNILTHDFVVSKVDKSSGEVLSSLIFDSNTVEAEMVFAKEGQPDISFNYSKDRAIDLLMKIIGGSHDIS